MLSGQTKMKLLLCSSASLCFVIAGAAAPTVLFAQQNNPNAATFQTNLASPLSNLKDAQQSFSKINGMVSDTPGRAMGPREEAVNALQRIRSNVLQVQNSNKVPPELIQDTLIAIGEAQTALKTDGGQTIAYSLQTVGQEVQALQAKLTGENAGQNASQGEAAKTAANAPVEQQPAPAKAPEQQPKVADAQPPAQAQQPQPAQSNQPAQAPAMSAANQPAEPQQTVASMNRGQVAGKSLYDSNGNQVATI